MARNVEAFVQFLSCSKVHVTTRSHLSRYINVTKVYEILNVDILVLCIVLMYLFRNGPQKYCQKLKFRHMVVLATERLSEGKSKAYGCFSHIEIVRS